ncbi:MULTISPECIES: phospholipase D-like domain-containing protein [unclassified Micromonospora]|uniref:phospholipase D-like domain-containing protein n=1 Tax=unclassified Micromonospora TaxID=2617518 RepID=UPI001C5E071C|nr:phospholipase D-like domain-containing protein [Micromonospora sp. RL09-050-HVF-A]MBW4700416.1 hypothetical protein [Micromonospora sp. RL09-050-HVF-A]
MVTLADRVVTGGFFVHRSSAPRRTPFDGAVADPAEPYRHCWTYQGGGSTIRGELLSMLDGAREKIFVGTLFLGDRAVREALVRAATRLRGGVYVLSALDDKGLDKAINEVDDGMSIDDQTEYRNFKELTRQGIYVRGRPGVHAKFVVVDDRVALVSSANLVTRSFDVVGENGVVVTDPAHAGYLARLFARLWAESPWEMPPDRDHYLVQSRAVDRHGTIAEPAGNGPIWTYGKQFAILQAIRETVDNARSDLLLATFSVANMTYPLLRMTARPEILFEPIRRAVERGVRVRLLMRGRNHIRAARAEATAFAAAGVEIHADRLTHAKAVIADGRDGALFSANFLTDYGLLGGAEVGMRLDGTAALADADRYFRHVIAEADLEFVRDPTLGRLAESIYAEALNTKWRPSVVEVQRGPGLAVLAAGDGPVLFEQQPDSAEILLYSGRDQLILTPSREPGGYQLDLLPGSTRSSAEQLELWLTAARPARAAGPSPRRGLCASPFRVRTP